MNSVERMWRALAAGDWETAEAELHPNATVEWPHTGERFANRAAFMAVHRTYPGAPPWELEVRCVITEGRRVASDVLVRSADDAWHVASFFGLHDGRILQAVEYWVPAAAAES